MPFLRLSDQSAQGGRKIPFPPLRGGKVGIFPTTRYCAPYPNRFSDRLSDHINQNHKMTTNIILTLTWALATNSVLIGKVRHVDVPLSNPDQSTMLAVMRYDRVTLTYRHDLSSNLVASFSLLGTTQNVLIQSVPVRSWTSEENTWESPTLMLNSTLTPAVGGTGGTQ